MADRLANSFHKYSFYSTRNSTAATIGAYWEFGLNSPDVGCFAEYGLEEERGKHTETTINRSINDNFNVA